MLKVSIGIIAYNEEQHLPRVLEDVKQQTFPHDKLEVVLIDSMSQDGTRAQMDNFAAQYGSEFLKIQVLENPGQIQSCGWNRAIGAFTTDVLIRVDAHSSIPKNFVENNVAALDAGEYITGGRRPNITESDSEWQEVLLTAESSMFGSSIADFRRAEKKEYVKSFFHGAYRREVFDKVGGFREDLGRTEDNEFHYRIRKHGFRLCMVPEIISYQRIRPDFRNMCRQKFANGYWVGLTTGVCPGCLSWYHFVPFAFVCGILLTTVLAVRGYWLLGALMWGGYWLMAVLMAVLSVRGKKKYVGYLILPMLFFGLHISYGLGTVVGLIHMPFWRGRQIGTEEQ